LDELKEMNASYEELSMAIETLIGVLPDRKFREEREN